MLVLLRFLGRPVCWPLASLLLAASSGCRPTEQLRLEAPETTGAARQVVALGRLDPTLGVISISAVPGERLQYFAPTVEEGREVQPGAVLGRLSSYGLRAKQAAALQTRLELAQSQRTHDRALAEAQREQALAARAQALAKLEEVKSQALTLSNLGESASIAREDLERLHVLRETDPELTTDHQFRRQSNLTARAENEYNAADAAYPHALRAAEMAVAAAEANVRLSDKTLRQLENVDTTQAIAKELEVAQEALAQSELHAPDNGNSSAYRVLKTVIQAGEFVTQMPVLQVADLSKMSCIAEVYEADVKLIREGQKARILSPAFSDAYGAKGIMGTVTRIGSLVANPDLASRNPLAPVDRSVVDVTIAIDPQDVAATAEAARRIGLQVTVEFVEESAQSIVESAVGNAISAPGAASDSSSAQPSG